MWGDTCGGMVTCGGNDLAFIVTTIAQEGPCRIMERDVGVGEGAPYLGAYAGGLPPRLAPVLGT